LSSNRPNQKRAFADVVSVDAWHDAFAGKRRKVDLHADIVFGTAPVGGEIESPVRFRLAVKRAELVIIVPPTELVSVDPASVARGAPTTKGKMTETVETHSAYHTEGAASMSLSPKSTSGAASAKIGGALGKTRKKKVELSTIISGNQVTQSKTSHGHYRWIIEMRDGNVLDGKVWDAKKEPRLKLQDDRKRPEIISIEPAVRLEVRCRTEDLHITDIEIKDEGLWTQVSSRFGLKNRLAAAIAFIKHELAESGLEFGNIEDKFGQITLAQIVAETRRNS